MMQLANYEKLFQSTSRTSSPSWLAEHRKNAWQMVLQQGLPHIKQEAWKYSRLHDIHYSELALNQFVDHDEHSKVLDYVAQLRQIHPSFVPSLADESALTMVFKNGRLIHLPEKLPEQVTLRSLQSVLTDSKLSEEIKLTTRFGTLLDQQSDGMSALNAALWQDGLVLYVQPGFTLSTPIHCIYLFDEAPDHAFTVLRHFMVLGKNAQATLIEQFVGMNVQASGITNSASEIFLEPNAQLTLLRIGQEPQMHHHIDNVRIHLTEQSVFHGYSLACAQTWARYDWRVFFQAPHAQATINGLFFAQHKQFIDHQITMDHQSPFGHSRQAFFGMVDDQAKAVYNGKVLVAEAAHHTNAQQNNKNILLSPQAEIFAKPELQIYNQEVQCQHGASVGQLDPQALFYLQSRGLSFTDARQMLLAGFAEQFTLSLPASLQALAQNILAQYLNSTKANREATVVN